MSVMPSLQNTLAGSLLEKGIISQEQYQQALELGKQNRSSLLRVLTEIGALSDDRRLEILTSQYQVKSVKLEPKKLNTEYADLLGRERCSRLRLLPLERQDDTLIVAMEDPTDVKAIGDLEGIYQLAVSPVVCTSKELDAALPRVTLISDDEVARINQRRVKGVLAVAFLLTLTLVPISVSYYFLFSDPEISAWFQGLELTSFTVALMLMIFYISWASIAYFITDLIFGSKR